MNNISVKTAQSDSDIELIEALAEKIWNQHYTPIIGKNQVDYMLDKFQSCEAMKDDISKGYTYFIVSVAGKPCGYSAVKADNGVFLSKFYVEEEARGKGAGKAMLSAINDYAKKKNLKRIWLTCNKYNPTVDIYKKLGYTIADSIVTDIGGGFVMDDYVMEKEL